MQHLFGYVFNPFEPVNLRIDESAIKDIYKVPDMFISNYCPPNNIYGAILFQLWKSSETSKNGLDRKWLKIVAGYDLRNTRDTKTWSKAVNILKGEIVNSEFLIKDVLHAYYEVLVDTGYEPSAKFLDSLAKEVFETPGTLQNKLAIFSTKFKEKFHSFPKSVQKNTCMILELIMKKVPDWIKNRYKQ